jgi:CPA1 family monovalent cation:H+ antiporter
VIEIFERLLILVVVIAIVVTLSRRVSAPWPVLLVVAGLALSFVPEFANVELEPDLVLVVVLPPLLFGAAWYTPVHEFRRYRRAILMLSVGLVLFTVCVVGITAAAAVSALPLAAAFALGAIVAPPDAIAAVAVLRTLAVPRKMVTILEGESLVNDATALTAYGVSVAAAVSGVFEPGQAILEFGWAVASGISVGIGVAVICGAIWARLFDPPVEISLSLVIPYLAYLPAEQIHGSGVIAVVSAGLYLGYRSSRILASDARVLGTSVWEWVTYTLNGFAFLLIGLQLPTVLEDVRLGDVPVEVAVISAVAVSIAVIAARFVWVFATMYLPRALGASEPVPPRKHLVVVSWAGMRGAVSLAAALALPIGFPERDLLVFIAFAVILVTLVGQGLTLAPLIRFLRVEPGDEVEREEEVARRTAVDAALAELVRLRGVWPGHLPLIDRLSDGFQHRLEHLGGPDGDGEVTESEEERLEHREILASVIGAEREAVIAMRARGEIDDGVLRAMERELDLEELRLSAEA